MGARNAMIRTASRSTSASSDHCRSEFVRALDQRVHRFADRNFGQAAHLGDQPAQPRDVLVERLDGVFHCHPSRTFR
jgi:hypothetical protein